MARKKSAKSAKRPERWVRSTCPYCGVGCGVEAGVTKGRLVAIRGDSSHPANFGKLCPKPAGLPEAIHSPDRLVHPMRRAGDGKMERISWHEALDEIAGRLKDTLEEHGPKTAAFYISGQLLTEDYYVINKLSKGFLGINNVDSNSRLCMSSAVAGYVGAFGTDGPPAAYADIGHADCIMLWGSNAAECHPITFDRIKQRKKDPKVSVIVVDPRRTPTAEIADVFLQIKAGTDLALANAMLRVLIEEDFVDRRFVGRHTNGFEEAAEVANHWSPQRAARACEVPAEDVVRAARMFGEAGASLSFWTMGVNQSTVGTLKNRAVINLHLATGNIGRPGAGPFSLTGQPNAMGGREVGGLAHLLPGYRLIENAEHRREIEEAWELTPGSISEEPGLAATELFRTLDEGDVRFLWIAGTNPAVSVPDLARTKRALGNAGFVVVQDAYPTETTRFADLVLPAAQWGEKAGTMTNSERRVTFAEKVVEPPGEARADWRIFVGVAQRLGFGRSFAWKDSSEVYAEYRELTRGRPTDVTGLSHERLQRGPAQWPVPDALPRPERPSGRIRRPEPGEEHPGTMRLYTDKKFNTPNGRARFAPTPHTDLHEPRGEEYPLVLSTGRIKNQWHTMTRTGRSEKLMKGLDGPFVEIHPEVAGEVGVKDGDQVRIVSARGSFTARAVVTQSVEPGTVFTPFHWGDLWTEGGSVNDTTHDATDPVSKQPELKGAAVRLEPSARLAGEESRLSSGRRQVPGGSYMSDKLKVVVVGNGIAGAALVDELLEKQGSRSIDITLYGAEKVGTYDRVRLSEYMAGAVGLTELGMRPKKWYEERGIDLRLGVRVVGVDTKRREVSGSDGEWVGYDRLVFATGSESFVPPIPGRDKKGVFVFRTVEDVEMMLEAAPKRAVVIGGGLLGLEAAWGLVARGAEVTVVDLAEHLMSQQLDAAAGVMLGRKIKEMGVEIRLGALTEEIHGNGKVEGVRLRGGEEIVADTVVVCAGIRSNAKLAGDCGIEINRGIIVNDRMQTSAENVYAIGECAEHNGVVYGLVAPALEQVRVVTATLLREEASYPGSTTSATLKVMGVDVTSAGDVYGKVLGSEAIVSSNPVKGTYRKAVIRQGKVVGAILLGDITGAPQLTDAVKRSLPAEEVVELTLGADGEFEAPPLPDDAQVCGCNGVSKGQIVEIIKKEDLKSVSAVGAATKAGTGCGSCKSILANILSEVSDGPVEEEPEYLCRCMRLSREDIRTVARERGIKSVGELGAACGAGKVCPDCKPGLAYVVSEINANRHQEERHARHINDRVHANIQKDGTFSVVPRIYGGVTNPDELRRIADVAEKYDARMVKITGGQRLDILGLKKEDLPKAWADLGMPSGFAYTKAVRTVKTCVGTDFCRYGVGDSTGLGIAIEQAFENLYTPAKVKMGCSGCPRNCAEATVKDIGVVAIEGGWKVYVAGAAGALVRAADELAEVKTEEEVMKVTAAFLQYYRENAEYKERTYDFVPRVGLEKIRSIVLDEESGEPERLRQRLRAAKEAAFDPWKERTGPKTNNQFAGVIGHE